MNLNNKQVIYLENKLNALSKSKFRSSFHIRKYMYEQINKRGIEAIEQDAEKFIRERLAPQYPKNDGRQTPMKNHPVFIAQHACGCCCRKCLEKWHKIPQGNELTEREIRYIVTLIMYWIHKEINSSL